MRRSLLRFIGLYLAVSLLAGSVLSVSAQNAPELDLERIQRATVFVIQASADDLSTRCVGTGTLVRYDGLILTNAHNTLPSANCPGDELVIAMSSAPDEPPVPRYRAEIAGADSGLDLALLRITRELDGRLIEPGSLPVLPFVDIADVGGVNLDQTITVVGYPGIGNQSVQSIAGTVTGFIAEPGQGNRSWIKTTAVEPIPGTMSGGGAYNQRGELIGVPTTAPVRVGDEAGSCRLLEDTNDDGFINSNDSCVPIGDFIDVLRPASFARPLVRSASLGLTVENLTASSVRNTTTEPPSIVRDRLFFALSVDNGLPDSVISSAPAGTTSLYLFFDYRNFTPQTIYELRVSINGTPSPEFSLPPVQWSGGTSGLWYIGSSGQPWPNGTYEFRLFVDGLSAASKAITIGGPAQQRPTFSKVAFGLLDDSGVFQGESYVLPAGNTVEARFIYRNMQPGMNWGAVWYFNGGVLTQQQSSWAANAELTDPVNGTRPVSIDVAQGLQPGNYRLELYIQQPGSDRPTLSAMGEFVVAGQPEGVLPDVFSEPLFFRASNTLEQPTGNPSGTFPDGANTLYARFDWSTIAPGTLWTMRWEVDGTIFYEQTVPWRVGNTGSDYSVRVTAPGGLPDGTYTMSLLINDILLEVSEVSVGIGQLEIDRLAQTGGVQLRGQIVDAVTGEGIEGASFILISEDFSVADFTWRQEQIYALAITDSNGEFEIDRLLQIGSPYSVLIEIEGYLPIARDAFTFNEETLAEVGGSPVDMYIPMTRD